MYRVQLNRSPYDFLFCPFCGTKTSEPDGENFMECSHLVYYNMGEDPEDSQDYKPQETDICFTFFEPAPASIECYFVFRED